MRRNDRECLEPQFIEAVCQQAEFMSIAMHNGEYPYCIPVNFAKLNNSLYIHCAKEGLKLECIKNNGHVAFDLAIDIKVDVKKSTTYYKSLCGIGDAHIIKDIEEKRAALDAIANKYKAACPVPSTDANINRVHIIRIDIVQISGKQCLEKKD